MRKLILATSMIAALVAAGVNAAGMKRIKKEADFTAVIVGKKMEKGKDWVQINADGTLNGSFGGRKAKGAWNWQKGFFCRNIILGGKTLGSDCQIVQSDGSQAEFIREQGKGGSGGIYTIN